MKSDYRRLGDYIQELKVRNTEEKAEQLLGININKFFMPSVANVVGTDLSVYKLVRKNQFACNRMHVGRDYRLPISMSKSNDEFMVSPAYDVFEIIDTKVLNPEYLMMWFTRREFDRNAWFYTDADVRGGLSWKSFCDIQIPIPHIHKQREIVKEYNVIQNRIALNQQLIQKLEETAQAIYREWFVEFEFPYDFAQGKPDEKGKPYKSSGGEMVWCEELGKEIPLGWEYGTLKNISDQLMGFAFKGEQYTSESGISVLRGENVSERFLRWDNHKKWNDVIVPRMEKCYLKENDIVIGMDGSKVGKNWAKVSRYDLPLLLAQRVSCLRGKRKEYQNFIFYSMCVLDFESYVSQVQTGTSIPHISGQQIFDFPILVPEKSTINKYDKVISKMVIHNYNIIKENQKLTELKDLLLSKLATIE